VQKKHDKAAALDHVLYEIEMLTYALQALTSPKCVNDRVRSGWLEVFAIHARNLNEFFAKPEKCRGYMKPHHFIPTWTYKYEFDANLHRRASGQIVHLTYRRQRPEEKTPWPLEEHFNALRKEAIVFLEAVASDEALMTYHQNRKRTKTLSETLAAINVEGLNNANTANIAPAQPLTLDTWHCF
jgi:hypothetical protein